MPHADSNIQPVRICRLIRVFASMSLTQHLNGVGGVWAGVEGAEEWRGGEAREQRKNNHKSTHVIKLPVIFK